MQIDSSGNSYLLGRTDSADFPLKFPINSNLDQRPGNITFFLSKISSNGSLLFSSFIQGIDNVLEMHLDLAGDVIMVGDTTTSDFTLKNAFDTSFGGGVSGFITKISASGDLLF